ncbi:MAG: PEP-utilizing enzyme [Rhodobacteraceae bacterium]|nr:PEP-utilizing enzyme [Paracoccaceae bacterium]MCY4250062.1 PEP-utilizing enzyme [Paracoccaceae bacterium]MCY4306682.1 PEP-utilizing enzyme [Paracoccaceae bacterium]
MHYSLIEENGNVLNRDEFGGKASKLSKLPQMGISIPRSVVLPIKTVRSVAQGSILNTDELLSHFPEDSLLAVRPSAQHVEWGGLQAILNVGMNTRSFQKIVNNLGQELAELIYLNFIVDYSVRVFRLDPEEFEDIQGRKIPQVEKIKHALDFYQSEMDEEFTQDSREQLYHCIRSMARIWEGTTARMLRRAQDAPEDSGLGLIIQEMVYQSGNGVLKFGKSHLQTISKQESRHEITYFDVVLPGKNQIKPDTTNEVRNTLNKYHSTLRGELKDEFELVFIAENNQPVILDYKIPTRTVNSEIKVAVKLVKDNIINKSDALMRIDPESLTRAIHVQLGDFNQEKILSRGIAASPGAASGVIVFSSRAAEEMAIKEQSCILVRPETGPEDIKGMYTAKGVLTGRGGLTSHAAVIARSLGVPCVAAATDLEFNPKEKTLVAKSGTILSEGDHITIDGSDGIVIEGFVPKVRQSLDTDFDTFLNWSDEIRDIGVRANADTLDEVAVAKGFGAEGIGLCRTEHMFFAESRLTVMREMIFRDSTEDRREVLKDLLVMQKGDFQELFVQMAGFPVCIRLLDPPLHEFLPRDQEEIRELADALDLPASQIYTRMDELREFNPMLGMRGVRLGITMPEIYEMQARAIFEAAAKVVRSGLKANPEIMIPLVSANREVELVKDLVDTIALDVQEKTGSELTYKIGVMVETPRAAMRAGDLAEKSSFLSFGTNDLTQLAFGISRDDASRIIDEYLKKGVLDADPFVSIDNDGVGELLHMAVQRGRKVRKDLILSICGEHSADPDTIQFCREANFSYVSCTPYRIPIAKLAAAQCVILDELENDEKATT